MKKTSLALVAILIQVAACVSTHHRPNISAIPATPIDAVSGILAAFKEHSVVALGEGNHNNEQAHAFRLSLVRDPRFADTVNDIVVEFGAAQNQGMIDRFLSGEDVPNGDLKKIWQDTTQIFPVWDVPIYEEFIRAVRAVNMNLAKEKRLRILLGDPPVDWNKVGTVAMRHDRDGHAADLIKREVLAKKRRALVIYGDWHFFRSEPTMVDVKDESKTWPKQPDPSLITRLEKQNGIRVYNVKTYTEGQDITTLQPEAKSWPAPSLIRLKGTILGVQPFGFYLHGPVKMMGPDGVEHDLVVLPEFTMEEQFDAMLYLGPTSSITTSRLAASLCLDPAYIKMRKTRAALEGVPGIAEAIETMIKTECDEVLKKRAK